jgi:hypothetical protein
MEFPLTATACPVALRRKWTVSICTIRERQGWTTPEVNRSEAIRGFHGAVLPVREVRETERFPIEELGFRKTGVDGAYQRFETGAGGANKTVTLLHEPDRPAESRTFGAGTFDPIALWSAAGDGVLTKQKEIYGGARPHGRVRDKGPFSLPLYVLAASRRSVQGASYTRRQTGPVGYSERGIILPQAPVRRRRIPPKARPHSGRTCWMRASPRPPTA